MEGREVTVAGWLHEIRDIGKIVFMQVRDRTGIVQVTAKAGDADGSVLNEMRMPKESVVTVKGTIKKNAEARSGFEIIPKKVTNLNPISAVIPFEVTGKVPADLDVRLDFRYIDLRRLESTAIFNIESTILKAFRDALTKKGFIEIRTPSIVSESTEGGADLFSVQYFEKKAYLAQSPQLYKQLAVIGGFDRVFMIVPVFRAEKFNTPEHINEITQMDIEIGFADHKDAIRMLKHTMVYMLKEVGKRNASDLERLGAKLEIPKPAEITYKQAVDKLNANGSAIEFGSDFSREQEKALCNLFGEILIVKDYPTKIRAFYSMPSRKNPEISNSYDLLYRGMEICSGAQRIHIPELLVEALNKRGLDPKNFEFYINAFRNGAPPHAGWSIGLERLAMQITGRKNIRECTMFPRDRNRISP